MSRQQSPLVAQRNAALVQRMRELKAEPPFWGSRRIWAYRHFVEPRSVNKKRLWRLMREHPLPVQPNLRRKAKRTSAGRTPPPTKPNAWRGIDMTKGLVQSVGWVSIVVVRAWYTKAIVGYHGRSQSTARHWLAALDMAVHRQFPEGGGTRGCR